MSLVIATAVAEGIVIGADSRTTNRNYSVGGQPRIGSEYEEKLFEVCGLAIGTSGCSNFGGQRIAEHIAEFAKSLQQKPTFDEVATGLAIHFQKLRAAHVAKVAAEPAPADPKEAEGAQSLKEAALANSGIYFLVAGFDGDYPRVDRIFVTEPDPKLAPQGFARITAFKDGTGGVEFIGMTDVCERLIHGYSVTLLDGIPPDIDRKLKSTATNIPFSSWKLQDAMNLVWTLFHVTMFMQRISVSRPELGMEHPNVGGEIEYISVRKSGVKWEIRKDTSVRPTMPDPPDVDD
ncbi:MAG: hypothetical protein JWM87_1530 [Candidatus Eremiobacteraeota bacterium]|nr:hypothetical protein [Candidatus Eremiobacteraeota bacterium]